jgi:hypothetical protein
MQWGTKTQISKIPPKENFDALELKFLEFDPNDPSRSVQSIMTV